MRPAVDLHGRSCIIQNPCWLSGGFSTGRWDKNYSACHLDDMPHKRLTRPERVFEFFFDGVRKGRGRENILRLEVTLASNLQSLPGLSCTSPYRPAMDLAGWMH